MTNDIEVKRLAKFAEEILRCPLIVAEMRPESAVHLVGLLQLALRHPRVSDDSRKVAQTFIDHVREAFANAPTVLAVIREGDHETH